MQSRECLDSRLTSRLSRASSFYFTSPVVTAHTPHDNAAAGLAGSSVADRENSAHAPRPSSVARSSTRSTPHAPRHAHGGRARVGAGAHTAHRTTRHTRSTVCGDRALARGSAHAQVEVCQDDSEERPLPSTRCLSFSLLFHAMSLLACCRSAAAFFCDSSRSPAAVRFRR